MTSTNSTGDDISQGAADTNSPVTVSKSIFPCVVLRNWPLSPRTVDTKQTWALLREASSIDCGSGHTGIPVEVGRLRGPSFHDYSCSSANTIQFFFSSVHHPSKLQELNACHELKLCTTVSLTRPYTHFPADVTYVACLR